VGEITNFPYGASSFGVVLPAAPFYFNVFGAGTIYVNGNNGADGQYGTDPTTAVKTMGRAFQLIQSGQTIILEGQVKEQITAPLNVSDVTILGAGTNPRYGNESSFTNPLLDYAAAWRPPTSPAATTPLLTLRQQGWRFVNILFDCPSDAAGVLLKRAEDAVDPDPSHASFYGCDFVDGATGIQDIGGSSNITIDTCRFQRLTSRSVYSSAQAIALPLQWLVQNNTFSDVNGGMTFPGSNCVIQNNLFMDGATSHYTNGKINTSGGARNMVINNYTFDLSADVDPAHGYTGSATDVWRTFAIDAADPVITSPPA
jgi:hypothetical protein